MSKQNLYVAFFNSLLGVVLSLLLKGNLLTFVLTTVIFLTIIFMERKWIYEKIFRKKKWRAAVGYGFMLASLFAFLVFMSEPKRDTRLIVQSVHQFLDHIQPGQYEEAYLALSAVSQAHYSKKDFVDDHETMRITIEDFRIDEIVFNEFDKKKAVVKISSSFSIYGQNESSLEVIKENNVWKVAFNPKMIDHKTSLNGLNPILAPNQSEEKNKPGWIRRFFRKIF